MWEERHLRQALREAFCSADEADDDPAKYDLAHETVTLFERLLGDLDARRELTEHRSAG